jgi:hypothetical protein
MAKRIGIIALAIVLLTAAAFYAERRDQEQEGEIFKREGLPIRFAMPSELRAVYPNAHEEPWNLGTGGLVVKLTTLPEGLKNLKDIAYCTIKVDASRQKITSLTTWFENEWPADPGDVDESIKVGNVPAVMRIRNYTEEQPEQSSLYIQVFIPHDPMFYKIFLIAKGRATFREECRKHLNAIIDSMYFENKSL